MAIGAPAVGPKLPLVTWPICVARRVDDLGAVARRHAPVQPDADALAPRPGGQLARMMPAPGKFASARRRRGMVQPSPASTGVVSSSMSLP